MEKINEPAWPIAICASMINANGQPDIVGVTFYHQPPTARSEVK